ncbi:MAG: phosphoribosylamine--glycine ligase, partial [Euryarchaeota archaeon]|nr:phosphoribosylamine--glycine ligase [Euryarchaeota archaeon]
MKVLVVGGGGREHCIVETLRRSGAEVLAVMGNQNPGIRRTAREAVTHDMTDVPWIVEWANSGGAELAVIGPEAPLAAGTVDALDAAGIPATGPTKAAAQIETNKEFMRNLMREHKIPGLVDYWAFDDLKTFKAWLKDCKIELVVKPLGLTGGRGVKVMGDHLANYDEVLEYAQEILEQRIGGAARFLVEERVVGEEFSLQCLTDGKTVVPTPLAQDHKRALEGDKGPNTGGMGSYSDANHLLPFLTSKDRETALSICQKVVEAMRKNGTPFKGCLYGGFIATASGVRVLEFNARFADPECMNVLPLVEGDFADACERIATRTLKANLPFARKATVCKYVVPIGYGTKAVSGERLVVDEKGIVGTGAHLYYASVNEADGAVVTTTSRALAVV